MTAAAAYYVRADKKRTLHISAQRQDDPAGSILAFCGYKFPRYRAGWLERDERILCQRCEIIRKMREHGVMAVQRVGG